MTSHHNYKNLHSALISMLSASISTVFTRVIINDVEGAKKCFKITFGAPIFIKASEIQCIELEQDVGVYIGNRIMNYFIDVNLMKS